MLHNQIYHDRPISVQLTRKEKKKKDGILKLPPGLKGVGLGLGINGTPLKDVASMFFLFFLVFSVFEFVKNVLLFLTFIRETFLKYLVFFLKSLQELLKQEINRVFLEVYL